MNHDASPRRQLRPQRASKTRAPVASLAALLLGAFLLLVAGSALNLPFVSRPHSAPAPASTWQTLLSRWIEAATDPNAARNARPERVAANAAFSAPLSDPAPHLADAARRNANIALPQTNFPSLETVGAPQLLLGLRAPSDDATFDALPDFGAQYVVAGGQNALRERARQQQIRALQFFLNDVSTRQALARRGAESEARGVLDDDIANALHLDLPSLTPDLLSDSLRLELTNLRLKLGPNLGVSEQERQRTAARLKVVEAQWRARLREQEAARATELAQLRDEQPVRLRREGEAQIEATTRQAQARDAGLISQLRREQNGRIAADFATAPLGITLPAASKAAPNAAKKAAVLPPKHGFRGRSPGHL